MHKHVLKNEGTQLTFELMGKVESSDDETESEIQSGSATQSAHSKGSKQKEINKEKPPRKKLKPSSEHCPSTSTPSVYEVETNQTVVREDHPSRASIDQAMNDSMESTI